MLTTVRNESAPIAPAVPSGPSDPSGPARSAAKGWRRFGAAPLLLCVAALLVLSACTGIDQGNALKVLAHDRAVHGVGAVLPSSALTPSAQEHAQEMAADGYLFHSRLSLGRGECTMGENVGYGGSITDVEKAFMASAPHRANILDGRYDRVGLGVARTAGRVWVVQLFVGTC